MTRWKDGRKENFMLKTKINLQLFAEGVGGDGGATVETGAEVVTAENNAELATQQQADNDSLATNNEESFESLIKGKYKSDYEKAVQKIVGERLKNSEKPKKELEALKPFVEAAKSRYGIDDVSKLADAFLEDEFYINHLAMQTGQDKEDILKNIRADRERQAKETQYNADMEELQMYRSAEVKREEFNKYFQEAVSLKNKYGEFDVSALFGNEEFKSRLDKGYSVEDAFLIVHHDDIVGGVMQKTAQEVKDGVVKSIASNSKRPLENASSGQSASRTTIDVNSLTEKDIRTIIKEVESGKKIKF